jgi:hypothetical protein
VTDLLRDCLYDAAMIFIERVRKVAVQTDDAQKLFVTNNRGAQATSKSWNRGPRDFT